MAPDSPLPQERDLAEHFQVSRSTLRQALKKLTAEGRIYARRGRGTFVSAPRISKDGRLTSFTEDTQARGLRPGTRVLQVGEEPAGPDVAAALELDPGSPVVHLKRLRLADGFPMCLDEIWLPSRLPDRQGRNMTGETRHRMLNGDTGWIYECLKAVGWSRNAC